MVKPYDPDMPPEEAIEALSALGFPIHNATEINAQLSEHIGSGADAVLITPNRWGEDKLHFIHSALWPTRTVVVITPSRGLSLQEQNLRELRIPYLALNTDSPIDATTIKDMVAGKYRAVFMTPDLVQGNHLIAKMWYESQAWWNIMAAVVFDEAHVMALWGEAYRKPFVYLRDTRQRLSKDFTFIAVSPVLFGVNLKVVEWSIGLDYKQHRMPYTYMVQDMLRPNVFLSIRRVEPQEDMMDSLDFVLDDTKKTIVYFESLEDTMAAWKHLRAMSPSAGVAKGISPYHAKMAAAAKANVMDQFRQGEVRILLSTEWADMDYDVLDVERVVQYKCPENLSAVVRRFVRAGKNSVSGESVLLVQPQSAQGDAPTGDKNLLRWINSTGCQRELLRRICCNPEEDSHSTHLI